MINEITVASPGRINLIGDHTDYHDGFVLPAAVDKKITVKLKRNGHPTRCRVTAKNAEETYEFDLSNYRPLSGGWQNYVMGVVRETENAGGKITGFDAVFGGDIPIGSGMSSSAALECAFAYALNEVFACQFSRQQLIKLSQKAEHNFVGMNCGIMDQFSSMMGRKNQVMMLDCRTLDYKYFPLALGDYQILLLNSNVSHSLAESAYNQRRRESEAGIKVIQEKYSAVRHLRDVDLSMLAEFKAALSPTVYRRCHHVITENQRVSDAARALKNGNFKRLGDLMYASHAGLQNDYEVSCEEVDFLVQKTVKHSEILGSRMMGGGFGGCTINIIRKDFAETFTASVSEDYRAKFNLEVTPYRVSIEDGTHVLQTA